MSFERIIHLLTQGCARLGISGVARGSRPLPEREVSSPFPISLPPQAAQKNNARALPSYSGMIDFGIYSLL